MVESNLRHILLVFGGRSGEHDVSAISASNILPYFDPRKYWVTLLYIARDGQWYLCDKDRFKCHSDVPDEIHASIDKRPAYLAIGVKNGFRLVDAQSDKPVRVDMVFSVLHGIRGAGGYMQGLYEIAGVQFVGPSVRGAAIGFDKDMMKRLWAYAGLPICNYLVFNKNDGDYAQWETIRQQLGTPVFVKPSNSGSSLGVHKVGTENDLNTALEDAFTYDDKVIIETCVEGSELELYCFGCGKEIKTTIVRETVVGTEFGYYSYEAKYGSNNATLNEKYVPARIPESAHAKARHLGAEAYRVLDGRGLARIDLFYSKAGEVILNELNTVPSLMSPISQPSLWEHSGVSHYELVDMMISEAVFSN